MDSKVFVSYSRKDKSEVESIIANIEESLGIKCWIDLKGIETSTEYDELVVEAIEKCEIVLFMISPNSIASKYVKSEINYAEKKEKRIVLICLNDSRPDKWALLKFPNVDYIRASNEDQMNKFIHDMEGWLGIQAVGPVLKELSKLYEDWEKLEHEQTGILQHVIEKEESIGNRDKSVSEKIKSQYIKEEKYNKLIQENEHLKGENNELKKEIKELDLSRLQLKTQIDDLKKNLLADFAILEIQDKDLIITYGNKYSKKRIIYPNGAESDELFCHNLNKINQEIAHNQDFCSILTYSQTFPYLKVRHLQQIANKYDYHVIRSISNVESVALCCLVLPTQFQFEGIVLVIIKNKENFDIGIFSIEDAICESIAISAKRSIIDVLNWKQSFECSVDVIVGIDLEPEEYNILKKSSNAIIQQRSISMVKEGSYYFYQILRGFHPLREETRELDYLSLSAFEESISIIDENGNPFKIIDNYSTIPTNKTIVISTVEDFQDELLVDLYLSKDNNRITIDNSNLLASILYKIDTPRLQKDVEITISVDIDSNSAINFSITDNYNNKSVIYNDIANDSSLHGGHNIDNHLLRPIIIER